MEKINNKKKEKRRAKDLVKKSKKGERKTKIFHITGSQGEGQWTMRASFF